MYSELTKKNIDLLKKELKENDESYSYCAVVTAIENLKAAELFAYRTFRERYRADCPCEML